MQTSANEKKSPSELTFTKANLISASESPCNSVDKANFIEIDQENVTKFIVDTGATEHLTKDKNIFNNLDKNKKSLIKFANKDSKADIIAEGKGDVLVYKLHDTFDTFQLRDVIYSPCLKENLLALRHFTDEGYKAELNNKFVKIFYSKTKEILATEFYKKLYWFIEIEIYKNHSKA